MTHTLGSCSFSESKVVCSGVMFCKADLSLTWIVLEWEERIFHQKMVVGGFLLSEGSLCNVESGETNLSAAQA